MENMQNIENTKGDSQFTVLLNGQQDLEQKLEEFKNASDAHVLNNYPGKRRGKKRYYNLPLMAKIVQKTTNEELKRLLKNGTRTFLIEAITNKSTEVDSLAAMIKQAVMEQQAEEPCIKLIVGLALEISGDYCRLGRIRNNTAILLERGNTIRLTTNVAYRYFGFKEIIYVINLKYYLNHFNINDQISIGPQVRGIIVNKLKSDITILIENTGVINSYDYIEIPNECYSLQERIINDIFNMDLELATKIQADFIVLTQIRSIASLKILQNNLKCKYNMKLIGSIDLEYVSTKMLDIMGLIQLLDLIWLSDLFNTTTNLHLYLCQDVIPMAKYLKKPIIGSVPLRHYSDWKIYENHEFLCKIDCIHIEKSPRCNKYPLIVKKLLPIKNYRLNTIDSIKSLCNTNSSSYQSVANFIIRTITSIECQAIFLYAKCEMAASALSRIEIYCPVFVLLPLNMNGKPENEEDQNFNLELAKILNLRRNLLIIPYTSDMNECDYKPIEFGLKYARSCGCIDTGDFIITLEVRKKNDNDGDGEDIQLGVGDDVVIMRAFYVPPLKVGEKFICD